MTPMGVKVLPGKEVWTLVSNEGETYVAVVELGPPRALGVVVCEGGTREVRKTATREAIAAIVG